MTSNRWLPVVLAIGALAAPASAVARPADTGQPPDMRASTASALAEKQDLRSPDARDAGAVRPVPVQAAPTQDLRSPDVRDAALRPAPAGEPTSGAAPQNAQPVVSTQPAPVDGGVDWTTIALGIAGSLVAVAGFGAVTNRRRTQRLRVSA